MIGSDFKDLFVLFLVFGGGFWVLAPLARAFAKRISATAPPLGQARVLDELREELRRLRQAVAEITVRVDFTGRAEAQHQPPPPLAPPSWMGRRLASAWSCRARRCGGCCCARARSVKSTRSASSATSWRTWRNSSRSSSSTGAWPTGGAVALYSLREGSG